MIRPQDFHLEVGRDVLLLVTVHFLSSLCSSADLTVRVPSSHLVAVRGRPVILGCEFSPDLGPNSTLSKLLVTWQRQETLGVAHSFYFGQDQLEKQDPDYRGRTKLFMSELKNGNASLKLEEVGPRDAGRYLCVVNTDKGTSRAELRLDYGAFYPEPSLSIDVGSSETLLEYKADGFPRPEVTWLTEDGKEMAALTSFLEDQANGFYRVTSSCLVPNGEFNITFVLKNELLHQHMRMPVRFKGGNSSYKNEMIAFIVISVVLAGAVLILLRMLYKKKKT